VVKKILAVYKADARDWERVGEWVERIGWPAFFEKTGLPFTKFHVSDWYLPRSTDPNLKYGKLGECYYHQYHSYLLHLHPTYHGEAQLGD
jgi:hypothetical protein